MYKKKQSIVYIILAIVLLISQLKIIPAYSEGILQPMKQGDDPGISISVPDTIVARQQVEIDVSLVSSAGNMNEDGKINITIPASIVADETELTSRLVIGDPFYLSDSPVTKNDNGDYVLQILYDHTLIDQQDAVGLTFTIKFTAPVFDASDPNIPENASFNAEMYQGDQLVSQDSGVSNIKGIDNNLTPLTKLSTRPVKYINGQKTSIMSLTDPSSNVFAITVNYNSKNLQHVKLVDKTPEGTTLTDPDNYVPCSGDKTPFNHIRIAKVTSRLEDGTPNEWQYVTAEFKDKISVDTNGFTIDFGNLTSDDSYIVMYAEEIVNDTTPDAFGIRNNHCEMYSENSLVSSYDVRLALDESSFNGISLNKKVEQNTLSVTEGELDYTLTFKNSSGLVPAGTVISDPLPEYTTYQSTVSKDNEVVSDPVYDKETNTLKYTLKKDLNEGENTVIHFSVIFNNPAAKPGESIINKASFNYKGTDIYSNMATTILDGSAYLTKVDNDTKNPLAGAKFKVVDSNGQIVLQDLTSDENGKVNTGLMKPGNYQFIETQAPDNYILDTKPINFSVSPGSVTPVQLTKTNSISGSVTLTKTDEASGEVLSGAEFELQDAQGKTLQKGLTTDKTGKLTVNDLTPGTYQFVETKAPTGYELDETPVKFTIEKGQKEAVSVKMTNKLTPGSVTLTKTDETSGEVLSGAKFELQDAQGKTLQKGLTTDKTGKLTVNDLTPGTYQFVETKAPTGYELDETPVKFTIEKGQKEAVSVKMTNKLTPGSVTLTKTDETSGEVLSGAEFELQDAQGKTLQKGLTTDKTGKLTVNDLTPGTYQFVETKAPTGYELDETPVKFTIEKGQKEAVSVKMTNKLTPGSVTLTKTDETSGEVLSGAEFELQDAQGKTLQKGLTTDKTGKLTVNDLTPGTYQFVETKASTGYELDETPVKFTIEKGQKEAVSVKMTNKLTPGSVTLTKTDSMKSKIEQHKSVFPKTNEKNQTSLMVIGIVVLMVVLGIYLYLLKRKK
ncbi:hypothetical protein I591_00470 [Enterococcus villorum ATCC 700913]|nr:LPXTG cell wall anchor domain-containing protein [Enterococcus villorum]EOW77617.1 hypothetical protein I591_00470 [Enterococcus villorum ATCC 700913]